MKDNDIIKLEYDAWIVNEDRLFDTTNEKLAKENDIYDEKMNYGYIITIIGKNRLIPGLEEDLKKAEIGKKREVTIEPANAYGEREPNKMKIHSFRELQRQKIEPQIGAEVIINNQKGIIKTITPGRVIIDYNHPLAGKALKYKYKVQEKIDSDEDKLKAIIEMNYPKDLEKFEFDIGKEIAITLPDSCKYDQTWNMAKYMIIGDIRAIIGNKTIKLIELYEKKEEKETKTKEKTDNKDSQKKTTKKTDDSKDKTEKKEPAKKKATEKTTANKDKKDNTKSETVKKGNDKKQTTKKKTETKK